MTGFHRLALLFLPKYVSKGHPLLIVEINTVNVTTNIYAGFIISKPFIIHYVF